MGSNQMMEGSVDVLRLARSVMNYFWKVTDRVFAFLENRFGDQVRIPLKETVTISERFGYKITNDRCDILDLAAGMRQAAVDGKLSIFGRRGKSALNRQLMYHYPLLLIPKDHFERAEIEILGYSQDNLYMRTRNRADESDVYVDLHVNKRQFLYWLRTEGRSWIGRTDKLNS